MPTRILSCLIVLASVLISTGSPAATQPSQPRLEISTSFESPHAAEPQALRANPFLSIVNDHQRANAISSPSAGAVNAGVATVLAAAIQVAAGQSHTCALTTAGGVKCWGANDSGQLGDGTTTSRSRPVEVVGLASDVIALAAGGRHTCALTAGRAVKCWGENGSGQLGDGTATDQHTPVDVVGLASGVTVLTAGSSHTCALMTTGGIQCWGSNSYGQLGDGTTTSRRVPVGVVGLASGVTALAAGGAYTCAITTAGGAKCWGYNGDGQLGDGTTSSRRTPVEVVGLASGVTALAAGGTHTCAVTTVGGAKCWGYNWTGQLGDGTQTDRRIPVDVIGLASSVTALELGEAHTCALMTAGGVQCWGNNYSGQLGDGMTASRPTPADVAGLATRVIALAAGQGHTCALMITDGVKCWGFNLDGQLGNGTTLRHPLPVDAPGRASGIAALTAGDNHTCAVTTASGAKCWGRNGDAQLGDGTTTSRLTPTDVIGLASGVTALAAGYLHTCALTTANEVKCWGYNGNGRLGDGTTTNRRTPVDVVDLTNGVTALAAGTSHTCAVTTTGGVKCWGYNGNGQLGDGTMTNRLTPVGAVGLASGAVALAANQTHTCAVTTAGGVKCWGFNGAGKLGDGTTTDSLTPVEVVGLASTVRALAAGWSHTCALLTTGWIQCWGANHLGQLGDGTTTSRTTPVDVVGLANGATALTADGHHTCAVTMAGGVQCWGENPYGQLGDGTTVSRLTPTEVLGMTSGVVALAAGEYHTCALTTAGGVKCWGLNNSGQFGIDPGWTPVDVVGFEGRACTPLLAACSMAAVSPLLLSRSRMAQDTPRPATARASISSPGWQPARIRSLLPRSATSSPHLFARSRSPRMRQGRISSGYAKIPRYRPPARRRLQLRHLL